MVQKSEHPFYVKSNWNPPVRQSVTLESYLEEVKLSLPEINLTKPKSNLPPAEREALKALKGDKQINLRKADKGTKFYGSFLFGLGVHGKLRTQSVALCCFSITPSFSISSRQIFKSAWTLSKHTQGKQPKTLLAKSAKVHFFLLLSMQSCDVLVAHRLEKKLSH